MALIKETGGEREEGINQGDDNKSRRKQILFAGLVCSLAYDFPLTHGHTESSGMNYMHIELSILTASRCSLVYRAVIIAWGAPRLNCEAGF